MYNLSDSFIPDRAWVFCVDFCFGWFIFLLFCSEKFCMCTRHAWYTTMTRNRYFIHEKSIQSFSSHCTMINQTLSYLIGLIYFVLTFVLVHITSLLLRANAWYCMYVKNVWYTTKLSPTIRTKNIYLWEISPKVPFSLCNSLSVFHLWVFYTVGFCFSSLSVRELMDFACLKTCMTTTTLSPLLWLKRSKTKKMPKYMASGLCSFFRLW